MAEVEHDKELAALSEEHAAVANALESDLVEAMSDKAEKKYVSASRSFAPPDPPPGNPKGDAEEVCYASSVVDCPPPCIVTSPRERVCK